MLGYRVIEGVLFGNVFSSGWTPLTSDYSYLFIEENLQ